MPEINLDGFKRLKVKDLKRMNYKESENAIVSIYDLDEETEVLYAENEADIGGLVISPCTNPPWGLEDYISEPHVYWLNGKGDDRWYHQVKEYLETNLPEQGCVKLWSMWFGDGYHKPSVIKRNLSQMSKEDFAWLNRQNSGCIELYRSENEIRC